MTHSRYSGLRTIAALATLTLAAPLAALGNTAHAASNGSTSVTRLKSLGTGSMAGPSSSSSTSSPLKYELSPNQDNSINRKPPKGKNPNGRVPADGVPHVQSSPVSAPGAGFFGFNGLNHLDQRYSG
ncbi:MAG: hypothetical protein ACRDFX_14745, partial [Chloroflexota bacterium]